MFMAGVHFENKGEFRMGSGDDNTINYRRKRIGCHQGYLLSAKTATNRDYLLIVRVEIHVDSDSIYLKEEF